MVKGGFDREKFLLLMKRGKVREEDFRELYPAQSKKSLVRTAHYYMKAMEGIGLAKRNADGWEVRSDTIRTIEEFERIREKVGYGGDLFEFITYLFKKSLDLIEKRAFFEILAEERGVEEEALRKFVEEFLNSFEWKDEKDLQTFLEEFKEGLWMKIGKEIRTEVLRQNAKRIEELQERGLSREQAIMTVLNRILKLIPLSLELWEKVEKDSPNSNVEIWIEDRLTERSELNGVEFVPVNKKLWDKLQEEVKELSEREKELAHLRLAERLNQAIEKTLKEIKEQKRRRKMKA